MSRNSRRDAFAGAISASFGLALSELVAGLVPSSPSLVEGIGDRIVDGAPTGVKDWAIATFGTNDKLALLVGIALVAILVGAAVGVASRRRFWVAIAVFVAFAGFAAWAASVPPDVSLPSALVPGIVAGVGGLLALRALQGIAEPADGDDSRRRFLLGAGAVVALASLSAGLGRFLLEQAKRAVAGRDEVVLPAAAEVLPPPGISNDLMVEGLVPIHVPNEDFYRIDTALSVPRVDLQEWTLSVTGMVQRPYAIDFADLLEMRMVERDITLSCVSNPVGGRLVGNARWLGVPLSEILDRAAPSAGASQIVGRSVDHFTVGFPFEAAYDGREALLAVGMNGEPLPFEHGFPARLVVSGLYGYVSATKWLSEIELTTWEGFDAYWVPRGWAKEGPIKTQSRIDTPGETDLVSPGRHSVAGVAWAPSRGISKVEVQLGEGAEWVEAEMSEPLSDATWVQWRVDWEATAPGRQLLRCRATDGRGELQTPDFAPPAPDGATGWHTRTVFVTEA